MDGLQRLLDFTNSLEDRRVIHRIEKISHSELMVRITMPGKRLEVYFAPEDVTYSVFTGPEDILEDTGEVERMIEEFCRD